MLVMCGFPLSLRAALTEQGQRLRNFESVCANAWREMLSRVMASLLICRAHRGEKNPPHLRKLERFGIGALFFFILVFTVAENAKGGKGTLLVGVVMERDGRDGALDARVDAMVVEL